MPGLMLFLLVNPCRQQTTRKVQSKLVRPVQTVFNLGIRTYMQEPSHLQHIFFVILNTVLAELDRKFGT